MVYNARTLRVELTATATYRSRSPSPFRIGRRGARSGATGAATVGSVTRGVTERPGAFVEVVAL